MQHVVTWTWNSISLCRAVPRSWKNKQFNEIAKTVCGEVEVDICGFSAQLHFPSSGTSVDPTLGELFLPHPSGETPFGFLGDSVWSLNMLSFSHRVNVCPRRDLLDTVSQRLGPWTRWNKTKQKPESGQSWSLCHASWRSSCCIDPGSCSVLLLSDLGPLTLLWIQRLSKICLCEPELVFVACNCKTLSMFRLTFSWTHWCSVFTSVLQKTMCRQENTYREQSENHSRKLSKMVEPHSSVHVGALSLLKVCMPNLAVKKGCEGIFSLGFPYFIHPSVINWVGQR